ncbi:MAG: hypothetical protein WKG07_45470 [Hymenobacter sp.]
MRTSPLFGASNLKRFLLKLDSVRRQGPDTLYVLSFAACRADHRSTGAYLMSNYQGRLLVRARDHAILHYEALWQLDTAAFNRTARQSQGKNDRKSILFTQFFTTDRATHVVDYRRGKRPLLRPPQRGPGPKYRPLYQG